MKIKTFIFFTLIGIILSGLTVIMLMPVFDKKENTGLIDQDQLQGPQNYAVASMSKGTILMLLAVGIVGALGISRTKKNSKESAQRNASQDASNYETVNEERQKLITKNS